MNSFLDFELDLSSLATDANGVSPHLPPPNATELFLLTNAQILVAFGGGAEGGGGLKTDYKFTGQREEAALGIYFFNARWMDPSLGRFTQPDTIVPTSTQGTQAWDRYAFVNNNPVRYNDPTGHWATDDECGSEGCDDSDANSGGRDKSDNTKPPSKNFGCPPEVPNCIVLEGIGA